MKTKTINIIIILMLLLSSSSLVFGQGETCSSAINVTALPFNESGNTSGKGDDYDSGDACSSNYMTGDDVVYSYTPSSNQIVTITISNTGGWAGVFLLDGCPDAGGNCVDQDGSSFGDVSIDNASLTAGQEYFIIISTWATPQSTPYTIDITSCDGTGSSCNNPHGISTLPFSNSNTACGACDIYDSGDACSSTYLNGKEYVYEYTPSTNETIILNLSNTPGRVGLFLTDGCIDVGSCIASEIAYSGDPDPIQANLTAGNTYYITVGFTSTQDCGSFDLDITSCNSEGSSCATAEVITGLPFNDDNSTCGSCDIYSNSDACASTYMNGEEYVYEYTPTSNQDVLISMSGTGGGAGIFLTQGCPDVGSCVAEDESSYYDPDVLSASLTAGVTYYIIAGFSASEGCGDYALNIIENLPPPPCGNNPLADNTCGNATPICNLNGFCGNTSDTYTDSDLGGNLASEFCGQIDNNSWLSFTATSTSAILIVGVSNCQYSSGIQMQAYETSDCNTFTSKSSCFNPGTEEDGVVVATDLVPGNKYYLMIDGYGGDNCDYVIGAGSGIELPIETQDTTICAGQSVTLRAINGSGSYSWNTTPVSTDDSIVVSPTVDTEYIVTSVGANPDCDTKDTATVTISPSPDATIGGNESVCDGNAASFDVTLTGTAPWSIDITNTTTAATVTISNIMTSPYTYTTNIAGTYEISAVSDAACTGTTNGNVVITVNSAPSAPTVTAPSPYCVGDVIADLSASGSGGTFTWYSDISLSTQVGTGATFTSGVDPNVAGTTSFWVTEAAGVCVSDSAKVDIVINAIPTINSLTQPSDYCIGQTIADLSASSSGGTIKWYSDSDLSNELATGGTYTPTLSNASAGTDTIWVAVEENNCVSEKDSVIIVVTAAPGGPTANGFVICKDASIEDLTVSGNVGSTFNWYSDITLLTLVGSGATFTPSIDNSVVGSIDFYVTELNNGCISEATVVAAEVIANPILPSYIAPANYCLNTIIGNIGADGNGNTLSWYADLGLTSFIGNGDSILPTVDNTTIGVTSFYVITDSSGCTSSVAQIDVNVVDGPEVPTGSNPTPICLEEAIPSLTASVTDGSSLEWFSDAGLTNQIGTGNTITPNVDSSIVGSTDFYVRSSDGNCYSDPLTLTITVLAKTAAPSAASPSTYCVEDVIADLTVSGSGGLFTWYSDSLLTVVVETGSTFTTGIDNSVADTIHFWVTETTGSCVSEATQVTVGIQSLDDATFSYASGSYCQTGADPTPTIDGLAGGVFSSTPAGLSITSGTGEIDLSGSAIGNYTITYTTSGACPNSSDQALSIIDSVITAFSYSKATYCDSEVDPLPTGTDFGVFSATPVGLDIDPTSGEIDLSESDPGIYTVKNLIGASSGCAPDSSTFVVEVIASVSPIVTNPSPYCDGEWINVITVDSIVGGVIKWYSDAGLTTLVHTGANYTPSVAFTTTFYVTQSNGICESGAEQVTITIMPTPSAPLAPSPDPYCTEDNIDPLTAVPSLGGVIRWYDSFGMEVAQGATYYTGVSNLVASTNNYTVTEDLNGCESAPTTVTLIVNERPTSPIVTSPIEVCQGGTIDTLWANGTGGTINWYSNADTSNKLAVGNYLVPAEVTAVPAMFDYFLTEYKNGCTSDTSGIRVYVIGQPSEPVPVDQIINLCDNASSVDSLKVQSVSGKVIWYMDAALTDSFNVGEVVACPHDLNTLTLGVNSYYAVHVIDQCTSDVVRIDIDFSATPVSPTGDSHEYCAGDVIAPLEATGTGTIKWFDEFGNQLGMGNSLTTGLIGTEIGLHKYYAVDESAKGCVSDDIEMTIEIFASPIAPTVNDSVYCDAVRVGGLTAASNSNGTLHWFTDNTLQTELYEGDYYVPGATVTTSYWVVDSLATCASSAVEVSLQVDNMTLIGTDEITSYYCSNDGLVTLADNLGSGITTGGLWQNAQGTTTDGTYNTAGGTNDFYYIILSGNICPNDTAIFHAYVEQAPDAGLSDNLSLCESDESIDLTTLLTTNDLSGSWTDEQGNAFDGTFVPGEDQAGDYTYTIVDPSGYCTSSAAVMTVSVTAQPDVNFVANTLEICEGQFVQFNSDAVFDAGSTFDWSFGNGKFSDKQDPDLVFYQEPGLYDVTLIVNTPTGSGRCSARMDSGAMIRVLAIPEASFDPSPRELTVLDGPVEFNNFTHANGADTLTYIWDFNDGETSEESNPSHQFKEVGFYTVVMVAANEMCADTTYEDITVDAEFTLFMPNAFSPNGDDINDLLKPVGVEEAIAEYTFEIWARTGELIWSTNDFNEGWDGFDHQKGKPYPAGMFSYKIDVVTWRGNTIPTITGTVILLP